MRINVYWRGFDLLDIEAHAFRRRKDDEPGGEAPKLQAAAHLADSSRAEPMAPDTTAFGFGLIHMTPDVAHCNGCAADRLAGESA
jgi:hypothetical protein